MYVQKLHHFCNTSSPDDSPKLGRKYLGNKQLRKIYQSIPDEYYKINTAIWKNICKQKMSIIFNEICINYIYYRLHLPFEFWYFLFTWVFCLEVREMHSYKSIFFVLLFLKRHLYAVTWYQALLSDINNLYTVVWFQVFLSNINDLCGFKYSLKLCIYIYIYSFQLCYSAPSICYSFYRKN